ncbi:MAG: hypothetical protein FOGNACKC_02247 [Anaerolineae bacterium]|nr:hypothetical protein [Anaerolineae bacterium]
MKPKIERGAPLTEMVKGSMEYTRHMIRLAFHTKFDRDDEDWFWIEEIFADYVIVSHEALPIDEFYQVAYRREGGSYVFDPREQWQVVELTYQPQRVAEGQQPKGGLKTESTRFVERIDSAIELVESNSPNPDGPWRIQGLGITAGVVNGNGRRYARHVLEAAIREVRNHLRESAGQGRMVLTGEADHPADKGHRAPLLQETIIVWDEIDLNGNQVLIGGNLIGTTLGKDVRVQMQAGVKPDISQRGYGHSVIIEENGQQIEEVLDLVITGYDLVADGSDPNAGVTIFESQQPEVKPEQERKMDPQTLEELRAKYPQLVAQIESERDEKQRQLLEAQLKARQAEDERVAREVKAREDALRQQLGIAEGADLAEALKQQQTQTKAMEEAQKAKDAELARLQEAEQQRQVTEHIETVVAETKYPDDIKKMLAESLAALAPASVEAVDSLMETKRKEYDALMARIELAKRGHGGVQVVGPVIERETGTPEFARASFEFTERLVERSLVRRRDLRKAVTPNEIFTRRYLEAFDRAYQSQLLDESRRLREWQEAESTADLNLPYSVSRAIITEAFPELVALSIFDFGLTDTSPTRIYFESYSAESGAQPAVTNEAFTSAHDQWVSLANKRLRNASITVTSNPAGTTYTMYDDYLIDYGNGRIMVLSTGTMANATSFLIDYSYDKVRGGENSPIQRGKGALSYQSIELMADRLATQITDEAITFARSQLGWDAQTRTMMMVVREIQEMIDYGAIRLAVASAVRSGNNGGTWNHSGGDQPNVLVEKLGVAKTAVMIDNYTPVFILLSYTNADLLSNWDGFKRDGFPDAVLYSTGFVGQVKGLPVYQSNQMPDSHGLIGHRELVQHRVLSTKPMSLKGPYPSFDANGNLIAAEQWYAEEYNATESLVANKGGYVTIS